MKSGEAAKMIGITPDTVNNWCKREDFHPFLSEGARMVHGFERDINQDDLAVLNTIWHIKKTEKGENKTWGAIVERLSGGFRYREVHTSADLETDLRTIPAPVAKQAVDIAIITEERKNALDKIDDLSLQISRLEQEKNQLKAEKDQLHENYQNKIDDLHKDYQDRIGNLYRELGKLEHKIGGLESQIKQEDDD